MNPSEARSDIDLAARHLIDADIALMTNHTIIQRDGPDQLVTWAVAPGSGPAFFQEPSLDEYVRLVGGGQFTAILKDGALLQMSMRFDRDGLVSHRYLYFPCPISISPEDVSEYGVTGYLELLTDREKMERLRLWGPLRFDYDRRASQANHPASHLTVGGHDCRVPVCSPLCVRDAVHFLLNHFYPATTIPADEVPPMRASPRTITSSEELSLHLTRRQPLPM